MFAREISESKLALLSCAVAVMGILSLFLFTHSDYAEVSIGAIDYFDENQKISFHGKITSINPGETRSSIRVCDRECVTVTFDNSLKNPHILYNGDYAFVKGTVSEYKRGKYISAHHISTGG